MPITIRKLLKSTRRVTGRLRNDIITHRTTPPAHNNLLPEVHWIEATAVLNATGEREIRRDLCERISCGFARAEAVSGAIHMSHSETRI